MAKKKRAQKRNIVQELWGIFFMALTLFTVLSLFSYSPTDPALNAVSNLNTIQNLCGIIGAYSADILFTIFGISAYASAFLFLSLSLMHFFGKQIKTRLKDIFYYLGLITFVSALIHLRFESIHISDYIIAGGGVIGGLIGEIFTHYLNKPGAYLVSASGSLLFFILSTHLTVAELASFGKNIAFSLGAFIATLSQRCWTFFIHCSSQFWTHALKNPFKKLFSRSPSSEALLEDEEFEEEDDDETDDDEEVDEDDENEDDEDEDEEDEDEDEIDEDELEEIEPLPLSAKTKNAAGFSQAGPKILKKADPRQKRVPDSQLKFAKMSRAGYEPPPLSLLDTGDQIKIDVNEDALKKNSLLLEKKLRDFDVIGKVVAIHPGPVITMYEFEPSPGTKVNKIVNLSDDLSLSLGGRSVRILPHLPGKAALGIEVPNYEREIVWLKDIIASAPFQKSSNRLPMALGTNTKGEAEVADLGKMPHLLIAGATGSGKSVAINSIIMSLLYKLSPDDVKLILIDPKMLELSIYGAIPHLLLPVVTKPKQAIAAMRWAVKEMERRYRLMADTSCRNITGYNEKIAKKKITLTDQERADELLAQNPEAVVHTGKLPYLVIIIDELADLMMTSSQEMEETITRLAQMARAAGIHLILATQRPSVDVVTGLIKANFPARISFKVSSRHDSRTILDAIGSERLLGAGDMLFMSPNGDGILRHHGCFVTESEIARVVTHLKQQGEPIYNESILTYTEKGPAAEEGDFSDIDNEVYDAAVRLVTDNQQASISMVQRKLRIGYNRAARLIERMESEGIVGPSEGSKPRQVLGSRLE